LLLHSQQGHQGQNAAFAVIVDAHSERDIFNSCDDEESPEHERKRAQDNACVGSAVGSTENGLECIKRTGPDIAKYDAERRQTESLQLTLRSLSRCLTGSLCWIFAQCAVQQELIVSRQPKWLPDNRVTSAPDKPDEWQPPIAFRKTVDLHCDNDTTQRADLADGAWGFLEHTATSLAMFESG
jgi:hypothetical protein